MPSMKTTEDNSTRTNYEEVYDIRLGFCCRICCFFRFYAMSVYALNTYAFLYAADNMIFLCFLPCGRSAHVRA